MKQLLFLLLFPCLALAQYQGNANQKITLGEQTTADGLVWRGIRADTTSKIVPFSDTSAYIILDTVEKTLWLYKAGQIPKWQQVGGSTLDTATMLLPYYRAGRNTIIQAADVPTLNQNTTGSAATLTTGRTIQTNLASTSAATFNGSANITPGVTGTLPVANGGTGQNTLTLNKVMIGNGANGVLTPTNLHWDNTNSRLGLGIINPIARFEIREDKSGLRFFTNDNTFSRIQFLADLNLGYIDNAGFIECGVETSNDSYFSLGNKTAGVLSEKFRVLANGNFGIGTGSPDQKLHVVGNARISGLANAANPVNVQVDVNGVLVRTSSIDIKEDVQSLPYGLNEVMLLQPSKFSYIDKYKYGEGYDIGFIAQDVNNVIPEAVGTGIESDIFMDSVKLIPVLTKAIQEQQTLIKALEQRILILENK